MTDRNTTWGRRVPPAVSAAVIGAVVLGLGGGVAVLLAEEPVDPGLNAAVRPPLPRGSYPTDPIPAGTPCPPLEAAGWLNGPPPVPGAPGPQLIVLEIWSGWCPGCKNTAPGLARAYREFSGKGVAFVSLTNEPLGAAEEYAAKFSAPWPCGYGASLPAAARFGAYSPARMGPTYNPGYEVQPTLFILGPDGRVLWNDESVRPRHQADTETWVHRVNAAIARHLAAVNKAG